MRALQRRKTEDDCNKAYDDDNVTDDDIIVKWSIFKERCGSSDQEQQRLPTKTRMKKKHFGKNHKGKERRARKNHRRQEPINSSDINCDLIMVVKHIHEPHD